MKKSILLTVIILFCIVPISTSQAMQRWTPAKDNLASNQKQLRELIMELGNPEFKANFLTENIKQLPETLIAQGGGAGSGGGTGIGGSSNSSGSSGNVNRRGHGRSTRGDDYNANSHRKKEPQENEEEWPKEEWPKGEWPKGEWGDAEYPED